MRYRRLVLLLLIGIPILAKAQIANRFDVVITEIMADPTPPVGLPNAEYIEIKNVSKTAFNLNGWKINDAGSSGTINASFVLQPDSIAILCSTGNVSTFSAFGRTIGVTSFPSLNNDGDVLCLKSPQGTTIHAVNYSLEWFQNEIKKDGGWSLEMIDSKNPCGGANNWKASIDAAGGTPGKKNSVNGVNNDTSSPQLLRSYSLDSTRIVLLFDEPLDSASASIAGNYSIANNIAVVSAVAQGPLFNCVELKTATPLLKQTVYTVVASNVRDCKGNLVSSSSNTRAGFAEEALARDVVINEILFNPRPGAYDYVELYNRSDKIIDANRLFIANRSAAGMLGSIKKLDEDPFYLFPGDYFAITEDLSSLQKEYLIQNPRNILVVCPVPSFPDDKGTAVITNVQGDVVDELCYSEKWQFALMNNFDGVALERIDPNDSSQKQSNWHSAASNSGYGTPTYQNSQFQQTSTVNAAIEVTPKVFSPDNDGRDDIATIAYKVTEPGYVANVSIFDANGRMVRHLAKNALLGLKGSWNWDGLNESGQKLAIGTYIVFTEIFNLQGKKQQFKNTVVLARRLS
jgi:hypothetical protein